MNLSLLEVVGNAGVFFQENACSVKYKKNWYCEKCSIFISKIIQNLNESREKLKI